MPASQGYGHPFGLAAHSAWDVKEVRQLKAQIETAGLSWDVVESIPVPNSVKLGMGSPHGWSCIGRLKGFAELRGVAAAVSAHLI